MRFLLIPIVISVALAGCTAGDTPPAAVVDIAPDEFDTAGVQGGSGGGGGRVNNAPPTLAAFASDRTSGDNGGGFTAVFSGTARDDNGEKSLVSLAIRATGGSPWTATHTIDNAEEKATSEPADFGPDGWKVWGGTKNDGELFFKFRKNFPAGTVAGTYSVKASATDKRNETGESSAVTIEIAKFSLITVAPDPVSAAGSAVVGAAWGGWNAAPGATNVPSANYIKLTNDGDKPDVSVIVDFTESAFAGTNDTEFSIPINGNLQFAWCEDTSPATTAPSECTFSFGPTSAEGSVQVDFTGKGNVIYVAYRIVDMPRPLAEQNYAAAYTVTEL